MSGDVELRRELWDHARQALGLLRPLSVEEAGRVDDLARWYLYGDEDVIDGAVCERVEYTDMVAAAENLRSVYAQSLESSAFVASRFPGLDHAIDRVTRLVNDEVPSE